MYLYLCCYNWLHILRSKKQIFQWLFFFASILFYTLQPEICSLAQLRELTFVPDRLWKRPHMFKKMGRSPRWHNPYFPGFLNHQPGNFRILHICLKTLCPTRCFLDVLAIIGLAAKEKNKLKNWPPPVSSILSTDWFWVALSGFFPV